ncbi:MAG: hypothetical protein KGJ51_11445, partial [Acidobacteriota bacterium]|nr:hypothetical protein [Acidobacteriota bacterium]
MASKSQMTGMVGVYLVAAELCKRNWIVSVTSRSAAGADLLVTDQECKKTWSVQVKTNARNTSFWLLNPNAKEIGDKSHMYIFVNLGDANKNKPDEFIVVPSDHVKKKMLVEKG